MTCWLNTLGRALGTGASIFPWRPQLQQGKKADHLVAGGFSCGDAPEIDGLPPAVGPADALEKG